METQGFLTKYKLLMAKEHTLTWKFIDCESNSNSIGHKYKDKNQDDLREGYSIISKI